MPANLTPEYLKAEQRYKNAVTNEEKLSALEEMMAKIPKHKGTEKLRADIKKRISKVKSILLHDKKHKKTGLYYDIKKEGAGQIVLTGLPNSGKSSILNLLTNAQPQIGDYPFTTQVPEIGMMKFENVQVQLVDMPAFSRNHFQGWAISIVRNTDALCIVINCRKNISSQLEEYFEVLTRCKIELHKSEEELETGYLHKRSMVLLNRLEQSMKNGIYVELRKKGLKKFVILELNDGLKCDVEVLKKELFRVLNVIRVYTKQPGEKPDMNDPVILKTGVTIMDFARQIHKDFMKKLRFAKVWSARTFEGQMVSHDFILEDGDIIELHI